MAKRDGSAARARAKAPREEGTTLTAVDGDSSIPIALDKVIHERLRLAIVSALAVHDTLTFNDLKAMLEASDGNVSVHARKLEDAGYIACKKGFDGRIPRTEYRLTAAGRKALERYLSHMEALIKRVGGA
ncbi:MAG TPA: transcriptional regulator [Gemmatimonadaceae bacterium]|nr:transcriptional regulator [Gemmatimonadaceae bacterium]